MQQGTREANVPDPDRTVNGAICCPKRLEDLSPLSWADGQDGLLEISVRSAKGLAISTLPGLNFNKVKRWLQSGGERTVNNQPIGGVWFNPVVTMPLRSMELTRFLRSGDPRAF